MPSFVAMLRGINVGGRHRVPMAELRALCGGLGWGNVRTYIQSGNVIFEAEGSETSLATTLAQALGAQFGFAVPVVVRSAASLLATRDRCPFPAAELPPTTLHVAFLSAVPDAAAVARLDPNRSPPDRFAVVADAMYLHTPIGAADSKLTVDWMERCLGGTATARNWRTVTELIALVGPV
jgi:uncharacterized protein (DUF1697 family)